MEKLDWLSVFVCLTNGETTLRSERRYQERSVFGSPWITYIVDLIPGKELSWTGAVPRGLWVTLQIIVGKLIHSADICESVLGTQLSSEYSDGHPLLPSLM